MKWRKLVEDDGTFAVEEGETYLFAIKTNQGWDYFVDSLVWDSETPPAWHDAQHGWDGRESEMMFTPIKCPDAWERVCSCVGYPEGQPAGTHFPYCARYSK